MSTTAMTTERAATAVPLWQRLPWWLSVLVVYALSRVLTTAVLLVGTLRQGANPFTGARPGLLEYSVIWDGVWYRRIVESGYPTTLPVDDAGHAVTNAWAFLPGYPYVIKALMTITTLPFDVAAVSVSVLAGAGTLLVFHRILLRVTGSAGTALFGATLLALNPVSLLFQVAYAESLGALLIAAGLLFALKRQYWLVLPVAVVMAFTRPGEIAFAFFLGLHILYRLYRRRDDPFPLREFVSAAIATLAGLIAGLAWPVIAGAVTGVPSAYTDTELAWRAAAIGHTEFLPFTGWFAAGEHRAGVVGLVAVAVFMLACVAALFVPAVRRLGVDLRLWTFAYLAYLFAVFYPQSSTIRLLMPVFPLIGALALPRSRVYRVAIVVVLIVVQSVWTLFVWHVTSKSPPPP